MGRTRCTSRSAWSGPASWARWIVPILLAVSLASRADAKIWLFNGTTEGWTVSSGSTVSSVGRKPHVVFATGGGLFSNTISPAFVPNSNGNHIRFRHKSTSGNISHFQFNSKTTLLHTAPLATRRL